MQNLFILTLLTSTLYLNLHAQLAIHDIQGNDNRSPVIGQSVITEPCAVTAIGDDFFLIESPQGSADNDPTTSEGLIVFTDSRPNLNVGDLVVVRGTVREIEGMTNISGFDVDYEQVGSNATLTEPVELDDNFPSKELADVVDLESVEGMRVRCRATVIAPTRGFEEIAGLTTSNSRPLREPGILAPGIAGLPVWDGNPEIFWLDPNALGAANNRFLGTGMEIETAGPLVQTDDGYIIWPDNYQVSGTTKQWDLRASASDEVSIGSINVLNLREDSDWLDVQFPKLARYIVERLGGPDIVALQEVGELSLLNDLIFYIEQLNPELNYRPYLIPSSGFINVAYLVREQVQVDNVQQLGNAESLSIGGRLHDRPPLLLEATLATDPPSSLTVLNVHIRSLNGIEGSDSDFVRIKRYEQSLSIARMVQARQAENLVVVGDFNAFPHTDGYVDVVAQVSGQASLGAEYPATMLVQPPLTNVASTLLPADEQYSYVYQGSANQLDHCLINDLPDYRVSDFGFARGNADASYAFYTNPNIATRSSDHDGFTLYLRPEAPFTSTQNVNTTAPQIYYPNPYPAGALISWPASWGEVECKLFASSGQGLRQWTALQQTQLYGLAAGCYYLQIQQGGNKHTVRLIIAQ